jgi:hypothetical protein
MRHLTLAAIAIGLAACTDNGVTAFNASPEVSIISHGEGDTVREGYLETLRGNVSDPDHATESLTVSWLIDGAPVCAESTVGPDGLVTCEHIFELDGGEVSLEARDPAGTAGVARVNLDVQETDAPTALITSPEAGATYYADQLIAFQGMIDDGEDEPEDLIVTWETTNLGDLGLTVEVTSTGEVEAYGNLDEGEHAVRLRAVDTTGKEALDSVLITVGPANTAPSCTITSPEDGSAGPQGTEVFFEAMVEDPDIQANELQVTWSSDQDGALRTSTPDSDGTVRVAISDLSVATHLVSLTVADEIGASCTDSIYYTVGTPPVLVLASPSDGDIVNEGEDLRFSATVSDSEDQPTDIAVSWTSSIDGEFSTQGADSTGEVSFRVDDLSGGDHTITVRATDTDGLYAERTIGVMVNLLPTQPTVTLSPDPAGTEDALTATASGSTDPDGTGTLSYTYDWYEDGASSAASTSAVFPAADTAKGSTYRVVVTANDGLGDGPSGEASITISNTDPVLIGPALSSGTAQVGDTISCYATATDVDAADTVTVSFAWSDGSTGSSYTVTSGDAPGDSITCTATADDGDGGVVSGSISITVSNSDPTVDSVTVSPADPRVGDELTCSASASDPDGGSPTLSYAWTGGSTGASYTVAASDDPGDSITCTATATDTDGGTGTGSASVTVANTDPVLGAVSISPSAAYNDDTLTCSASATDVDGGSPGLAYAWSDASTGASLGSSASLDLSALSVDSTATLSCTVTATDADGGSDSGSASITLTNRAPDVSVSLSPTSPSAADTITCGATVSDDDGDSPSTTFAWTVSGASVAATSTSGLTSTLAGAFAYADTVSCTATANDGKGGVGSGSGSVTISNAPPTITAVTLTPSSLQTLDTVTVNASVSDPEGDAVTVTYDWIVDGSTVVSGSSSNVLDGASWFDKGQTVQAEVVATDGVGTTRVSSSSITVDNTPPGAPTLGISPAAPTVGDSLVCTVDTASSDDDSDSVTYTMSWTVDGVAYEVGGTIDTGDPGFVGPSTTTWTDDTVDGYDVDLGQSWECTAVPNDGDDDGTPATTSVTVFESVSFDTCGQTGTTGPTQTQCDGIYLGTTLEGDVTVSSGIQYWTVPASGSYEIVAAGAAGGTNTDHSHIGGYGAEMIGTFSLTGGDVLAIVVGQEGSDGGEDAGGGGGTFVYNDTTGTLLIAAGGGGGGAENDDNSGNMSLYKNGVTGTCGQDAPAHSGGLTSGGCGGDGGDNDAYTYGQGGGGGFSGNGDGSGGGKAFLNGANGNGNGGFGGGAHGGGDGGGGAGGYSGGAAGSGGGSPDGPGGGGGSYNAGASQSNSDGANNGPGYVDISGS